MSDLEIKRMAYQLLLVITEQETGIDAVRQITAALRASEARALAQAAELCDARAWRWHQDSSAHRELLAAADAIRGLSEPPG